MKFCFLAFGIILLGVFASLGPISIQYNKDYKLETSYYLENPVVKEINRPNGTIDSAGRKILYWIQISDIHVNNASAARNAAFDEFCNTTISNIQPAFVLSTGDNLDGMHEQPNHQHYQDEREHLFWNQTLNKYNLNADFWFPGVGNHEKYNSGYNMSLYHKYVRNESQYAFDYVTSFGNYRFVMADTTQEYGLANNYCFFGETKREKLDHLEDLLNFGDPNDINHTIIAGHHPLNIISSETSTSGNDLGKIVLDAEIPAYLCGHIHIEDLYANNGQFSTLHCPAFRENRMYRICAFDNDIFSFSEQVQNQWPAVQITNPIDSQYYTETMELERMLDDNEIRVLIFDPADHTEITTEIFIDEESKGTLTYQGDNLWSFSWNPNEYTDDKSHKIKIAVTSPSGSSEQEIEINLNGFPQHSMKSILGLVVSLPYINIIRVLVAVLFIACLGRLIIPKLYYAIHKKKLRGRIPAYYDQPERSFFEKHYEKRWFTSAILPSYISIPLLVMTIYPLIGPSMIGPFNNDIMGILWPSQMNIDGEYVLTIYSIFYPAIILGGVLSLEFTIFRNYRNKAGVLSWGTFWVHLILSAVVPFIVWRYFGFGYIFLNPVFYIEFLISFWFVIVLYRSQRGQKKR